MTMEDSTLHGSFNLVVSVAVTLVSHFVDHKKDMFTLIQSTALYLDLRRKDTISFQYYSQTIKYSNIVHLGDVITIKEK